jgi:MFS family permease
MRSYDFPGGIRFWYVLCSHSFKNNLLTSIGCELWAPWSEELGRKPVLQLSLLFVNIFQLPVALAKNFTTIMVGRFFGGLSSAGGSVTLGMIADMWDSEHQVWVTHIHKTDLCD